MILKYKIKEKQKKKKKKNWKRKYKRMIFKRQEIIYKISKFI